MLEIRSKQVEGFEDHATGRFVRRAIEHVRRKLADRVGHLDDRRLRDWVRDGMARSETFGLKSEKQIMCFLDAEALLGYQFYEQPLHAWARFILRSPHLSAEDRARLLLASACSHYRDPAAK